LEIYFSSFIFLFSSHTTTGVNPSFSISLLFSESGGAPEGRLMNRRQIPETVSPLTTHFAPVHTQLKATGCGYDLNFKCFYLMAPAILLELRWSWLRLSGLPVPRDMVEGFSLPKFYYAS
jgi:hypothetical protein